MVNELKSDIMKTNVKLKAIMFIIVMSASIGKVSVAQQTGQYNFNFTYPDFITGDSINLFSYFDEGKVVIIDFMEYECGPCWTFHQFHVLNDFYAAHGPDGTNTAMVIQMCTFSDATLDNLTWDNGGGWNWLEGIDYPTLIIPEGDFYNAFGFLNAGTPTILRICPNKTYYTEYCMLPDMSAPSPPYTLEGLYDWKQNTCGVVTDVENNALEISVSVYPNPVSEILNIQGLEEGSTYDFILTNSLGQEVCNIKHNISSSIDISQFPEGLYIATIIEGKKTYAIKVMIDK